MSERYRRNRRVKKEDEPPVIRRGSKEGEGQLVNIKTGKEWSYMKWLYRKKDENE